MSNAYVICMRAAETSANPRPDVLPRDAAGYLVLETLHAMQMKPSISKHAISFMGS